MAGITPSFDAPSVASLSEAEIEAFACRVAEILVRHTNPKAFDVFVTRIEELLDRVDRKGKF
jgi:accessory colonization factor AcfC